MKTVRNNRFIGTFLLVTLALFTGCKSGVAPGPVKEPVSAPIAKEMPKTPAPAVVNQGNPSDAQSVLKQAAENSLNAKSVSSEIKMDIEMMGMKMQLVFDIAKNNESVYTKGEFMGMRFEVYSDGKNLVMLDPMSGRWTRVPAEQKDMMLSLEQIQRKMYGEQLQNAAFGKEETIQDKSYYVIEASVKSEALKDMLAGNNPMMQGMDIKFDKAVLKIWVEKNTCLISRTIINMEATMTGDIPGLGGSEPGKDIEDEEEVTEPKSPVSKPEDKKTEENRSDLPTGQAGRDSEPKTTKIKYEIDINNSNYNKVESIMVPPDAKKLLESAIPEAIEPANK